MDMVLASISGPWVGDPSRPSRSSPKAGLAWPQWSVWLSLDGGLGLTDCFRSTGGAAVPTTALSRPFLTDALMPHLEGRRGCCGISRLDGKGGQGARGHATGSLG